MTSDAILLRPMGRALSRRIAATLGALFALVLGLAWLAYRSLGAAPSSTPEPVPLPATVPQRAPAAAPATPGTDVLAFQLAEPADARVPALPLPAPVRSLLEAWGKQLRAHPDSRVVVTLACNEATDPLSERRVAAQIVHQLVGTDINPHRALLVLAPVDGSELARGDFRLTIGMAGP